MSALPKWAWALASFSGDEAADREGMTATLLADWFPGGTEPHPAKTKTLMAPAKPRNQFARSIGYNTPGGSLLPGALLMTMSAQLLAPFVFVNFCFSAFL